MKFLYSSYGHIPHWPSPPTSGLNYYDSDSEFSASIVLANAGGQIKRFNETHRLPIDLRIGVAKIFQVPGKILITAWNLTK